MMKRKYWFAVLLTGVFLQSCLKKDDYIKQLDYNTVGYKMADNFNLSLFTAALSRSSNDKRLLEPGPFTVLAPSNLAFQNFGYGSTTDVRTESLARINRISKYHILEGTFELDKLPYLFNQQIESLGGKLFVTHWIKDADTVITINGSKIILKNIPASNGLIQIMDKVLEPYQFDEISDAIASENSITLFSQALIRTGMYALLKQKGPYTVFAPSNAAMAAAGMKSIQDVNNTDPAVLTALINYHIVSDRKFVSDYILTTGKSGSSKQTMLNGYSMNVNLIQGDSDPAGVFSKINLQGPGNMVPVGIDKADLLSGNGVLHIVNGVFKIIR
nr:fasciclin domain-containing protein [Pedobacter sp. ASV19]